MSAAAPGTRSPGRPAAPPANRPGGFMGGGAWGAMGRPAEKPKNFKGTLVRLLGYHYKPVEGVAFCPDGRFALSTGEDAMRLWDLERGQERHDFSPGGASVAFSPGGKYLLGGWLNGCLHCWETPETAHLPP